MKEQNKTVIVAGLIVLTRANGNGFSKDIFHFPCSLEINNMCSGYSHLLPVMFWILAGLWSLPVFSQSVAMDWTYSNRPALASIRSISQIFSLDRWWFIRCKLMSALQLFKHTKSTHPRFNTSTFSTCYCGKRTKCSHSICEGYLGTM